MRLLALLLLLAGCGAPPATTLIGAEGTVVVVTWKFEPAAGGTGPAMVLEPVTLEDNRAVFALRGKNLGPLHGVAFRFVYDRAAAELVSYTPSGDWALAPLSKAVEARPGTLVVVASQHGPTGAIAADELGRIELKLTGTGMIRLELERTLAMGNNGLRIDTAWRGGVLRR